MRKRRLFLSTLQVLFQIKLIKRRHGILVLQLSAMVVVRTAVNRSNDPIHIWLQGMIILAMRKFLYEYIILQQNSTRILYSEQNLSLHEMKVVEYGNITFVNLFTTFNSSILSVRMMSTPPMMAVTGSTSNTLIT